LIERARNQFPQRTPEAKVKAVNFLLPHVRQVPNRLMRDELASEIAQKLGIDSAVLRQELRTAAGNRTAVQLKTPAEPQVTAAERILIRALSSSAELQTLDTRYSARDGAEEEFDPARQVRFALSAEPLHQDLAGEALLDRLLQGEDVADAMSLELDESDRRLLASVLMDDAEELTAELVEEAISALRRRRLELRQRHLQQQIKDAERRQDLSSLTQLIQEKQDLARALAGSTEAGTD